MSPKANVQVVHNWCIKNNDLSMVVKNILRPEHPVDYDGTAVAGTAQRPKYSSLIY